MSRDVQKVLDDYAKEHNFSDWDEFKKKQPPYTIIDIDLPNILKKFLKPIKALEVTPCELCGQVSCICKTSLI